MKPRGRPKKYRIVRTDPWISQFSPRGRPGRPDEVCLNLEEFEAIRLADFRGIDQKKAAQSMHISQQTFSRILAKARKTISEALVSGKIIRIQGGNYIITTPQGSKGTKQKPQPEPSKPAKAPRITLK